MIADLICDDEGAMTGQGAGRAISTNKNSRMQKAYERMLNFIGRRGAIALFLVTFIINPFFYPAAFACGAIWARPST